MGRACSPRHIEIPFVVGDLLVNVAFWSGWIAITDLASCGLLVIFASVSKSRRRTVNAFPESAIFQARIFFGLGRCFRSPCRDVGWRR